MIDPKLISNINKNLNTKKTDGTYKSERIITSAQGTEIMTSDSDKPLLNFCANNYLGLSNHPKIKKATMTAIESHGFGMSSVRFICGTQDLHKSLENKISQFLETEDSILYSSCFDANGGLFENLLTADDVIISASLNHASIIDGIRLSKADRLRYHYDDMDDLEDQLKKATSKRFRVVVTDGVFSMEGELAPLNKIALLCSRYKALLVVDDSHATGFIGEKGQGTAEYFGVQNEVDLFTGTLGKALGGATGGYISGKKEIIDWFRNTSRPYLFSNSLSPALVMGAITALEIIQSKEGERLIKASKENTRYFREEMTRRAFKIKEGIHPIVPIMIGSAKTASKMADDLLKQGIYVIAFSYPVVPKGEARIRVQISAVHTKEQLNKAISSFENVAKKYEVI